MNKILLTIFTILSFSCSAKEDHPIAENNRVVEGAIPMSRSMLRPELKDKAREKEAYVLSFFKTPDQQLMPLGFFAMVEDIRNVENLRKIRSRGINIIQSYGRVRSFEKALGNLEAARKAGIGVVQYLPGSYMERESPQWWQKRIRLIARDKQLMLWYLPEESQPEDLKDLQMLAGIIRSQDPYSRPLTTFVKSGQKIHWKNISKIVDAMILGIYPCHIKNPAPRADIRRYIDFAYEQNVPLIFSALEAFKSEKRRNVWPTPKEVRFDAYLSLISGSKGLFWYGHTYLIKNPKLYAAVLQLALELNGPTHLGEVFLLGQRADSIECQLIRGSAYAPPACAYQKDWWKKEKYLYSSPQWLALRHKKNIYIFAVNMNEKIGTADHGGPDYAVTVQFKNLPETVKNVEVLFEDRQLAVEDHSFTDSFDPIGTHIYRLEIE
ncbi:MAG: hypothetical protein DRP56_04325 [Planctomycetota bacterium]|nr:MAG: hypothetical protein DRP56_04325 [Planctomycetota bacterium]